MSCVSYAEAKLLVQDGDVVFVHGSPYDLVQALIMFFTGSEFSHCCIAFHVNIGGFKKLMCVEAQGHTKRRIMPLSLYQQYRFTIIAAPKPWDDVSERALSSIGLAKYNMLTAIYTGVSEYMKRRHNVNLPEIKRQDEICSVYCSDVYDLDVHGSPQALYQRLLEVSFER